VTKPPLIRLQNVGKTYQTRGGQHVAVSDVTMDIHEGDFIALVGPSGCGKTTVLKILADLHRADRGTVSVPPGGLSVGMVFQQPVLLKWRTILDNVLLPAEILRLPLPVARERAMHLLGLVGLEGHERNYPQELSGGMQQLRASHNCGTKCHVPSLEEGVETAETPGDGFRAGWLVAA